MRTSKISLSFSSPATHFARTRVLPLLLAMVCTVAGVPVNAAVVLPSTPLEGGVVVEPNIIFMLDDSNSMLEATMLTTESDPNLGIDLPVGGLVSNPSHPNDPDGLTDKDDNDLNDPDDGDDGDDVRNMELFSYTVNTLHYDPRKKYPAWNYSDGSLMPDRNYRNAFKDDALAYKSDGTPNSNVIDLALPIAATRAFYVPKIYVPGGHPTFQKNVATDYYRFRFKVSGGALLMDRCSYAQRPNMNYSWSIPASGCTDITSGNLTWYPPKANGEPDIANPIIRNVSEEGKNFAMWFSYHRTRIKSVKAGALKAFLDPGLANTRVGHMTFWDWMEFPRETGTGRYNPVPPFSVLNSSAIHIPVGSNNGRFVDVVASPSEPASTNRTDWYAWLTDLREGTGDGGFDLGTPSRSAMTYVGEYFSRSDANGPYGPETGADQISCRRNFNIFATDGFWNDGDGEIDPFYSKNDPINQPAKGVLGLPTALPADTDKESGDESLLWPDALKDNIVRSDNFGPTLADIAYHYWRSDLRPGVDDNVPVDIPRPDDLPGGIENGDPATVEDIANWQHMVTYAISIGLSGTLTRTESNPISPPFPGWTNPIVNKTGERIDDLWHAAVNGRGEFFGASNADELTTSLAGIFSKINAKKAAAANLIVDDVQLTDDSKAYQPLYQPGAWSGVLQAIGLKNPDDIDPGDDIFILDPPVWTTNTSMKSLADGGPLDHGDRDIFSFGHTGGDPAADPTLGGIEWVEGNLTSAQKQKLAPPSTPDVTIGDVVNYLRGDATNEQRQLPGGNGLFRDRQFQSTDDPQPFPTVLGDIIHSSPVFVDNDPNDDATIPDGKTVFVGANDGMLHAFDADSGTELFAYVPGSSDLVRSDMDNDGSPDPQAGIDYQVLHDYTQPGYAHKYTMDGQIVVSRREQTKNPSNPNDPGKNILVGTLGQGGKTVFALDVTDPDNFGTGDVLWEFTSDTLGEVLDAPVIVTVNAGGVSKPAVIIGNGYNSTLGRPAIIILDLMTGKPVGQSSDYNPPGPVGKGIYDTQSTALPNGNGMAAPSTWDSNADGVADFVYGGDLAGNVWKLDIRGEYGGRFGSLNKWEYSYKDAGEPAPIFQAMKGSVPQPITDAITVALHPTTFQRWLFFGTGRYLTATPNDPGNDDQQRWYGLIDDGINSDPDGKNEILDSELVNQKYYFNAQGQRVFAVGAGGPAYPTERGWFINLMVPGVNYDNDEAARIKDDEGSERIVSRPLFLGSMLVASSIIPTSNPCDPGGRGYINFIDPFTGGSVFYDPDGDGVSEEPPGGGSFEVPGGLPGQPGQLGFGDVKYFPYQDTGGGVGGPPTPLSGNWGRISWREIRRQ